MNLFSKNGLENPASFEEREISFEESDNGCKNR